MTRGVLVTTTINVPHQLRLWTKALTADDAVIIIGDMKSPHSAILDFIEEWPVQNVRYVTPDEQWHYPVSPYIPWNCIQRRNFGVLEAIKLRPSFITMIDDDNTPVTPGFMSVLSEMFERDSPRRVLSTPSGYLDIMPKLYTQTFGLRHRGSPPSLRGVYENVTAEIIGNVPLGVIESTWYGHPDIDALDRFHNNEKYTPNSAAVIPSLGTWAPFNSQATSFVAELAPLMFVWPYVGRADDIWGSYTARKVMDLHGFYARHGYPFVKHERDAYGARGFQSHLCDLENEILCYKYTDDIIAALRSITVPSDIIDEGSVLHTFEFVLEQLMNLPFLPAETVASFMPWIESVEMVNDYA